MKLSIRKFLLIHLLIAVTVITALTSLANYYLDEKAISSHLDNWLSQASLSFQAIIGDDLSQRNVAHLQQLIDQSNLIEAELAKNGVTVNPQAKFQFQIWNEQNQLLLHSSNMPAIPPPTHVSGFNNQTIDGLPWRIFTLHDDKSKMIVVTAERLDIRQQLGHKIALDALYILLISYPILGFAIWFIAGRGLNAIKRVASEVGHRAPHYLDPVDVKLVPYEVKPLVDELNKLFLRLQQGFEREKAFSANAAHELRTPLAALKTQAQVAQKSLSSQEREAALNKLIASVDRSTHVVQQLLTLSRLAPQANLQDVIDINMSKLVTEVVAEIAPDAIDKNIELELVGGDSNVMLKGILTALSILIRNVVDNAIRYTPSGGAIQIRISEDADQVSFQVNDNGPGIPPELRSQVFERFYRILGTKSPGSGLGLAIVQQIATLHEATVTLGTPANNIGLEVTVIFPKRVRKHG